MNYVFRFLARVCLDALRFLFVVFVFWPMLVLLVALAGFAHLTASMVQCLDALRGALRD